jgi:hypothetical protein
VELSFDAWGKRRNPDGTDDSSGSITSQTTRGFTGEEEFSVGSPVHLNGCVFEALLARMTRPIRPGRRQYGFKGS